MERVSELRQLLSGQDTPKPEAYNTAPPKNEKVETDSADQDVTDALDSLADTMAEVMNTNEPEPVLEPQPQPEPKPEPAPQSNPLRSALSKPTQLIYKPDTVLVSGSQ